MNGSAPAAPPAGDEPCEDCATPAEKGLAVLAFVFGLFVLAMAADMFLGGRLIGAVKGQLGEH